MRKAHLKLKENEQNYLRTLTTSGNLKARQLKRATTLLLLHQGKTMVEVAKLLDYCYPSIIALKQGFLKNGLLCLEEKPRSGRPPVIDGEQRAKITALACSTPPEGYSRWSLRLLAERVIELDFVEAISHNQIGVLLKKTSFSRIYEKRGVSAT